MKGYLILSVVALATIVNVNGLLDGIKRDDNVLVLTKDNFDEATTDTTILVEFCKLSFTNLVYCCQRNDDVLFFFVT